MSEDDSVEHEGKWTRDDLPRVADVRGPADTPSAAAAFYAVDEALDAVVEYLNAHHPKRDADALLYRAEQAERERDAAVAHAEQLRDERDDAVQSCMAVGRERDELKARALDAERELNPPVFDVDVERTIRAEFVGEGFRTKTPVEYRVIRAVCELFGVKAEPTVDPVEAKAQELWEVAKPSANATWSGTNELAKEQFCKVAAHVLGQEASRDD